MLQHRLLLSSRPHLAGPIRKHYRIDEREYSTHRVNSSGEEGIVLLVSIFSLLLLTLLGLALTTMGIVATSISTNTWENSEAFYIADSGITHAKALIFDLATDPNVFLQAGNDTACDGDELSGVRWAPLPRLQPEARLPQTQLKVKGGSG